MRPSVLIVAGTDPFLGAGCLADSRVAQHFGLDAFVVETALVDQDTTGVHSFLPSDASLFDQRIERVFANQGIAGVKIGMTASPDLVDRLAFRLERAGKHGRFPVVLDPVLSGGNADGTPLARGDMAEALKRLLPYVTLVTPNAKELAVLSGANEVSQVEIAEASARELVRLGAFACLLKGGHIEPIGTDWLVEGHRSRVPVHQGKPWNVDIHGTGCHLSTAIVAQLIKGHSLVDACTLASAWLHGLVAKNAFIFRGPGRAQFDSFRFGDG